MSRRPHFLVRSLTVLLLLLALVTAACDDDNDVEVDLGSFGRTAVIA